MILMHFKHKCMFLFILHVLPIIYSAYILAHISTMKYTYIFNIFIEYNQVSPTHLKEIFVAIGLLCHHSKSFLTWCLITAEIIDIMLPQMARCGS